MDDVAKTVGAAIALLLVWISLPSILAYFGLGSGTPGSGEGTLQSLKNAAAGFPSGGDPGGIPFFQDLQGASEMVRNSSCLLFGNCSADPTPANGGVIPDTYVTPSDAQIDAAVNEAGPAIEQWFQTANSNPGALTFGQSPLF